MEAAGLSYVSFCIYLPLVRERLFFFGKSQGTLKTDVCGNQVDKMFWNFRCMNFLILILLQFVCIAHF